MTGQPRERCPSCLGVGLRADLTDYPTPPDPPTPGAYPCGRCHGAGDVPIEALVTGGRCPLCRRVTGLPLVPVLAAPYWMPIEACHSCLSGEPGIDRPAVEVRA